VRIINFSLLCVDRHNDDILVENVDFLCPTPDSLMAENKVKVMHTSEQCTENQLDMATKRL